MFHSSGLRHEQYLIRSKSKYSKATLQSTARSSLESNASGTDSGYASTASSIPSMATAKVIEGSNPSVTSHVIMTSDRNNEILDNTSTEQVKKSTAVLPSTSSSSITTATTASVASTANSKLKTARKHTTPRQPDLVYACPRPLTFPFHNDDQFLPIAEADPRDVARISPSTTSHRINRASSLQSSTGTQKSLLSAVTVGSTRMFDSYGFNSSSYNGGQIKQTTLQSSAASSTYSRRSSLFGSIQQGTVRSLRSLFQLPNYSLNMMSSSKNSTTIPVQKLEIKKGTVQSLRDMFSKKRASFAQQQPIITAGYVPGVATVTNIHETNKKSSTTTTAQAKKTFTKAINDRVTAAFKKKTASSSTSSPSVPTNTTPNVTISIPVSTTSDMASNNSNRLRSSVDSMKERVASLSQKLKLSLKRRPPSNNNIQMSLSDRSPQPQTSKKGLFSAFKRLEKSKDLCFKQGEQFRIKKADDQPDTKTIKAVSSPENSSLPPTTTVAKLWRGLKKLVTRQNNSRVGVL